MGHKTKRILYIYKKLLSNHHVNVKHMAQFFNTNARTIQRDIQDIKSFLNEQNQTILYEKQHVTITLLIKTHLMTTIYRPMSLMK